MKYDEIVDDVSGFTMPSASKFDVFELFSLKNRTIVITGSANGIGRVAAIACGKAGGNIAITDKDFKAAKLGETPNISGLLEYVSFQCLVCLFNFSLSNPI